MKKRFIRRLAWRRGAVCGAALLAQTLASVAHASPVVAAENTRTVVSSAEQLPRRTVTLGKLPSEYLQAPVAELLAMLAPVERSLKDDLARYEIRDAATLRGYYAAQVTLAQLHQDWTAVPPLLAHMRELQDKPGPKAVSGISTRLMMQARQEGRDAAWLQAETSRQFMALDWQLAADQIKQIKGQLELFNPELILGIARQQLDTQARNAQMAVPEQLALTLATLRVQLDWLGPDRAALLAGIQQVVDAHAAQAMSRPDIWTPRQFSIAPQAKATPVAVGVWDSGVDMRLFKTTPVPGLAFTDEGLPSKDLLRPLGDARSRWPELRELIKGSMDLRAALDTEDARRLKQKIASLKADQTQVFQEDAGLAGLYVHGTHVAGIAVQGNPFARVFAGTMLWSNKVVPAVPSEERSRRTAAAFGEMVKAFQAQQVRVVNMSWRYGASRYEQALAFHGMGADAQERQRLARKLYAIERDALKAAIASAPEILFVAGSGNEDNSADFEEYIPAGLQLPNLITVGAVDPAGEETSFSTFGKTVVVHANGFEVDSLLPGGEHARLSGTSMASPQVANLAAKLFALNSQLSVAQVREAIVKGADTRGRVHLVNPRRSAELLGIPL